MAPKAQALCHDEVEYQVDHVYLFRPCSSQRVYSRDEPEFGQTPIREMKARIIGEWLQRLKLSATTKSNIRWIMSTCFDLAALNEFIPEMGKNPMSLIKLKGVTKRAKKIPEISVADFKKLLVALPEPLHTMVRSEEHTSELQSLRH